MEFDDLVAEYKKLNLVERKTHAKAALIAVGRELSENEMDNNGLGEEDSQVELLRKLYCHLREALGTLKTILGEDTPVFVQDLPPWKNVPQVKSVQAVPMPDLESTTLKNAVELLLKTTKTSLQPELWASVAKMAKKGTVTTINQTLLKALQELTTKKARASFLKDCKMAGIDTRKLENALKKSDKIAAKAKKKSRKTKV